MTLPRARPLDAIAAAVPDVDRILVPDEATAEALGRRLDDPSRVTTPERAVGAVRPEPLDRLADLAGVVDAPLSTLDRLVRTRTRVWR
ncbi:MAG: hypothetical protein ACLFM8_06910, partial [Halobacteriales archaeon]